MKFQRKSRFLSNYFLFFSGFWCLGVAVATNDTESRFKLLGVAFSRGRFGQSFYIGFGKNASQEFKEAATICDRFLKLFHAKQTTDF